MTTPVTVVLRFKDDGIVPNNARLPLILYRNVLGSAVAEPEQAFIDRFASNGWGDAWINGIYGYQHFHTDGHEVLGIAKGHVRVQLGGAHGPVLEATAGDALVIPAGVAHCNKGASADLAVVGAYPPGQSAAISRPEQISLAAALERVRKVALPATDPVLGKTGPLVELWRRG